MAYFLDFIEALQIKKIRIRILSLTLKKMI